MRLPSICNREPRTQAGAVRQYNAILRLYRRAWAGGGAYGWGWPTFRMNWQEGHDKARALYHAACALPEVRS